MKYIASAIEQLLGAIALVLFSPLLAAIGIAILVLSRRTPLVLHRRLGRGGRPFWMLKFRTMWGGPNASRSRALLEKLPEGPVPEIKGADPRVTSRFAVFCRKYSIDELPQLWHVATGRMSLVGPRPVTAAEWTKHYGDSAAEVLRLKPGLSGLWQTRGRNRLTYRQRRRLDLFLARHYCLLLYLRILGATVPRVVAGRDAW
ncbi:MAG TPA: sugar transferase [Bryobacteraceae bacterium]|nr:sugar transferase [Bryobacteraceae bacterium]